MRSSGRMKLYMSIGLTALLIVQVIVFRLIRPESTTMISVIFGMIVFFSILAVFSDYLSLKSVEKRVESLPKEFQTFFIDANEAIGISSMKRHYKRDTMDLILEILEHAYKDNRSIEEVVGSDKSAYIDGFIEASGGQLSPLYLFGYGLGNYVMYLLLMKVYLLSKAGGLSKELFQASPLDVGIVGAYGVICFVFLPWLLIVLQKAAKNQWTGLKRVWILVPFCVPLSLLSILIFIENASLRQFLDQSIPIFMSSVDVLWALGLMGVSYLITQYARKEQMKKVIASE